VESALVVHLVSPGAAAVRSNLDAPDGSVCHEVVSWRDWPPTLPGADLVVAHGLPALVVAQLIDENSQRLVYRPSGPTRVRRHRWCRRLHVAWIAAPDRRSGRTAAASLGLAKNRVVVVGDDDPAAWSVLVSSALHHVGPRSDHTTADPRAPKPARPAAPVPGPPPFAPGDSGNTEAGDTATEPVPRADEPSPHRPPAPRPDAERPSTIAAPPVAWRPGKLAMGNVEPTSSGHRWWMYRRTNVPPDAPDGAVSNGAPGAGPPPAGPPPGRGQGTPDPEPQNRPEGDHEIVSTVTRSGVWFFVIGAIILGSVVLAAQLGKIGEAPFLIPTAALFFALAAARRISRNHPDEQWVGRWLVIGLIAKLLASYIRYFTLTVTYNGVGDATDYDKYGRRYANAWLHGGSPPALENLRQTNFVRWFTGVVYFVFGQNLLAGTFVFGLLALIGSYFWYRATVDAVPFVDKRLYLGFILFAPSIAFWPALVGKEALMQLGVGTVALGTAFLLRQRLLSGFAIVLGGGWLLWVVRPHLLALVAIGAGSAYLAGRVRKRGRNAGLLSRPLGIIIVAFLVTFTIGQGAQFLGIDSFSTKSIKAELDAQTASSAEGGSKFNNGQNSLNPIYLPRDAVTVLLRPFPWETDSGLQLLASLESAVLAMLVVLRFRSLRIAFSRSRDTPFLMFCWVLTALYVVAFSSFANFGLLVRQRSLVLPAVLVLLAADPALERRRRESEPRPEESTVGAP
jgi:hypothetical protein